MAHSITKKTINESEVLSATGLGVIQKSGPRQMPLDYFNYMDNIPTKFSLCRLEEDPNTVFAVTTQHQFNDRSEDIKDSSHLITENVEVLSLINNDTIKVLQNQPYSGWQRQTDCWGFSYALPYEPTEHGEHADHSHDDKEQLSYYIANKPFHHFAICNNSVQTVVVDISSPNNPKIVPVLLPGSECTELNYIPNQDPEETSGWGDAKVYDVTTLQVVRHNQSSRSSQKKCCDKKKSCNRKKCCDKKKCSHSQEKCKDDLLSVHNFVELKNGKMMYILSIDGNTVRVQTNDFIYPGDELPGSNFSITSAYRDAFAYTCHENLSSLEITDLSKLWEDPEHPKVELVKTVYGGNTDPDTAIGTTDWGFQGAHNLYVDNEQGKLYVVAIDLGAGPNYILDIKSDPANPILEAIFGDQSGINPPPRTFSIHDIVTATYTKQEQHKLLGIPRQYATNSLTLAFMSQGDLYNFMLADVTDPANIKYLQYDVKQLTDSGYPHAGWFTTDKRFVVANDEDQADNRTPRNTIFKLYWIGDVGKVQLIEVQNVFTKSLGENHNGYVYSNRRIWPQWYANDRHYDPNCYYNSQEFEDWLYSSNYGVGTEIISLKYKKDYDFTSTLLMDEPFDVEYKGRVRHFIDRQVSPGPICWSNYLFGGFEIPASEAPFVSTNDGIVFAKYSQGFTQKEVKSTIFQTRNLTLLGCGCDGSNSSGEKRLVRNNDPEHDDPEHEIDLDSLTGSEIRSDIINLKLRKIDGSSSSKTFALVSSTDSLTDIRIYKTTFDDQDLEEIYVPYLDENPSGSLIGCFDESIVSKVKLLSPEKSMFRSWSTYQSIGRHDGCIEGNGYEFVRQIEVERRSEVLVDAPSNPGDSGAPILSETTGNLVGIVRDRNKNGGITGMIGAKVIRNLLTFFGDTNPSVTSLVTEVEGVINNRLAGITQEDPSKYAIAYISPLTNRMYGRIFLSTYGYLLGTMWQSIEYSNTPEGWFNYDGGANCGYTRVFDVKFGGETINGISVADITIPDPGAAFQSCDRTTMIPPDCPWRYFTMKMPVNMISGSFEDIRVGEELFNDEVISDTGRMNGGRAVVISKISGSGNSGILEVFPVTRRGERTYTACTEWVYNPDGIDPAEGTLRSFSGNGPINPLGSFIVAPPKAEDELNGEISGVKVIVPSGYDYNANENKVRYVDPSWLGADLSDPLNPTENPDWRTVGEPINHIVLFLGALNLHKKNVFESALPLTYLSPSPPFTGGMLGVRVKEPALTELIVDDVIPQIEQLFPGNEFQAKDEIVAIDSVPVNKDSIFSEYLHKQLDDDVVVTVVRDGNNVDLQRKYIIRGDTMLSLI